MRALQILRYLTEPQVQSIFRITRDIAASDEGSTSESGSSDDEATATDVKTLTAQGDLPQDFWQIQKLVRYLKIGNQGRMETEIQIVYKIWT